MMCAALVFCFFFFSARQFLCAQVPQRSCALSVVIPRSCIASATLAPQRNSPLTSPSLSLRQCTQKSSQINQPAPRVRVCASFRR